MFNSAQLLKICKKSRRKIRETVLRTNLPVSRKEVKRERCHVSEALQKFQDVCSGADAEAFR